MTKPEGWETMSRFDQEQFISCIMQFCRMRRADLPKPTTPWAAGEQARFEKKEHRSQVARANRTGKTRAWAKARAEAANA